jgi:transposase
MTSQHLVLAAGIDVGQRFLDVGLAPSGKTFRFPNAADGIAAILERLTHEGVGRVVLEAIGPYAQRLVSALQASKLAWSTRVVSRPFASSRGDVPRPTG